MKKFLHLVMTKSEKSDKFLPECLWKRQAGEKFSNLIFYFAILFFIIGFGFRDTPTPFGWYQQFMPNLGGRQIKDIFFIDSLTGWAVTSASGQNTDTIYVLKTTNSGDNWMILYRHIGQWFNAQQGYYRIYFLNQDIGYTCDVVSGFAKTTDGGMSWTYLNTNNDYEDMSILNVDTQWIVSLNPLTGGVFFTSNGGVSWNRQLFLGNQNPDHIYMFNERIGFVSNVYLNTSFYRTTNGGVDWGLISNNESFSWMFFIDSLMGWRSEPMKKTTDGGLTWVEQTLPYFGNGHIIVPSMKTFSNINKDTIWGEGGYMFIPGNSRGIIDFTSDGGNTWLFQTPDTSIRIGLYLFVKFINKLNGWAYSNNPTGIHTVTGGDTIFYTSVKKITSIIPDKFILEQNYPNPFNPRTIINYQLPESGFVDIKVFEVTGKLINELVKQKQNRGKYEVTFDGSTYSSGVYFYSLYVDGKLIVTKKMILIR